MFQYRGGEGRTTETFSVTLSRIVWSHLTTLKKGTSHHFLLFNGFTTPSNCYPQLVYPIRMTLSCITDYLIHLLYFGTLSAIWNWTSDRRHKTWSHKNPDCFIRLAYPLYYRYTILYSSWFVFLRLSIEAIVNNNEDLLNSFLQSSILDFIGDLLSTQSDPQILVFYLSW